VENIDHLVTTGLFSRIRHPMYAGFILWIVGWVVRDGAVVSLAVGLVGIGNILYWRRLEERALESGYGEVYRTYRQQTWF
jgi:protein-S-isoprenylcysteine O-methyltransferase Ste14